MPELPEVDAIAGVAARHSVGRVITDVEVVRQPKNKAYFGVGGKPVGATVERVFRVGKHVVFGLLGCGLYVDCHNAMTGYWDWEHEPWTFDYVEGAREAGDSDVRVRMTFDSGHVLRFHDLRFFGRLQIVSQLPQVGLELMETPSMLPGLPVITLPQFATWILADDRPVKQALMDQDCVTGIGNIYASEGCHLAGIDPHVRGRDLHPSQVPGRPTGRGGVEDPHGELRWPSGVSTLQLRQLRCEGQQG